MASAFQCLFVILTLGIPICECAAVFQDARCVMEESCFDLNTVEKTAAIVSKDVITADGDNILLKHNSFDKIRKKKELHSCVLLKIIDLFENVLVETQMSASDQHSKEMKHHFELIYIMDQLRDCVYQVKRGCEKLYQEADNTTSTEESEATMTPKAIAILQLQKLKNASEKLTDVDVQRRVMDELKSLHLYMQGKGFRNQKTD